MSNQIFNMVLLQAMYYGLWGILCIFFVGAFQRGFFVNYFKVRTSFGRLVMVKIRSPLRDYFARGYVEEGFLIYQIKRGWRDHDTIRLNIPQDINPFYKCMSVAWCDVDDEKHAICRTDYSTVCGYDAVKNNNLHTRALMKPTIASGTEKILLVLVIVAILIGLGALYMSYSSYAGIGELHRAMPGMLQNMAGTVMGGQTI